MAEDKFEKLLSLNLNNKKEKRKSGNNYLDYLSWTHAWTEMRKAYPDANYEIIKYENENGDILPYMYDERTGYMVNTKVSNGIKTHEMWLPVMDGANKAMKSISYEYETKYNGTKTVDAATMFDVNKAIMRCLVKNIAMFGIGLYIYSGEDLPEDTGLIEQEIEGEPTSLSIMIRECKSIDELEKLYSEHKSEIIANRNILDLVTLKGKALSEEVA